MAGGEVVNPAPIQALAADLVEWMAAGVVMDSWGAVVRELVENALDAAASQISVEVWPEQWRIRVADNGQGIPGEDLPQTVLAHTTSKLLPDVPLSQQTIRTLGFRGEALHSLAQVARLEIASRFAPDPHGWLARFGMQGSLQELRPAALAGGTIVTAHDLFADWSTRRVALAESSREIRQMIAVIQQSALTHPAISWEMRVNDQPSLSLWAGETAADILLQILPRLQRSDLGERRSGSLTVVLGLPDRYHRPRPDWLRVAVNRRFVQVPALVQTMQKSLQNTLPRHRHPLCLAFFELPPSQVDWNRHPAKTEVYVEGLSEHQSHLEGLIRAILQDLPLVQPTSGASQWLRAKEQQSLYRWQNSLRQESRDPLFPSHLGENVPSTALSGNPILSENSPSGSSKPWGDLKVLAQLQNTYILVEDSLGLWLVEQHVAHERVRYEDLQKQWQLMDLVRPILLENLTANQLENLEQLHLDPEPFGEGIWLIRRIPKILGHSDDSEANMKIALSELSECADLNAAQVATACRTAIKNGIPLTLQQMQQLIDRWQVSHNPHTCPHGRPIALRLAEKELARFFRRRWSICDGKNQGSKQKLGDLLANEILGE
ncbi:MAG: DNA mismatch repair endonuclease MutL [Cyanobacteriota bacterium]|nr:DNA mismatch repair endonuclease MutL [Cyanobacteriota bacterium]